MIAVYLLIVAAAIYIARRAVRTWTSSKKTGCGGGCGCERASKQMELQSDLTVRRR
jgi:hypothetical protein